MPTTSHIHPAAHVDPQAEIHPSARIGPGATVGPRVRIAEDVTLRPGAHIVQDAAIAAGCDIHPGAVVGGDPQDLKYNPSHHAAVEIGPGCVIREGATISRGAGDAGPTRLGAGCYLMAAAHIGHNCQIASNVIIANGACLAGHVRVAQGCFISALALIHQFVDIGEMCMFQGGAGVGQHVPPYCLIAHGPNTGVLGLNRVGLKRSGRFSKGDLDNLKTAFRLIYRKRDQTDWTLESALAQAEETATGPAAEAFLAFIRAAIAQGPPRARGLLGPAELARATRD
jgi:UDP-N-acetylglucosamine acyltransferase